jgi:hypothetical protein|tara:strand:+ start:331 stop:606 length:276 start_codon:yes stop_codon:yes gene_type:complete
MIKLTKVPLSSMIDMLKKIYDEGADFVDIEAHPTDGEQDTIKINVRPEYYVDSETQEADTFDTDPEYVVTEQDFEEEFPPISDEDINDLIK